MNSETRDSGRLPGGDDPQAERWLDVLAGRAEPSDADTRQAARARGLYVAEVDAELRRQQHDTGAQQRLKVLLNVMQAEGEAAARAAQAGTAGGGVADGTGLPIRLWRWLFPPAPGAAAWRLGSVAAGVLGVTVVMRMLMPGAGDDDASQMKSAPPPVVPAASMPAGVEPLVITAAEPLQDALALQAALARAGVQAEVFPLGPQARLEAQVPAAQAGAVQAELARLGLTWTPASAIVVLFTAP